LHHQAEECLLAALGCLGDKGLGLRGARIPRLRLEE